MPPRWPACRHAYKQPCRSVGLMACVLAGKPSRLLAVWTGGMPLCNPDSPPLRRPVVLLSRSPADRLSRFHAAKSARRKYCLPACRRVVYGPKHDYRSRKFQRRRRQIDARRSPGGLAARAGPRGHARRLRHAALVLAVGERGGAGGQGGPARRRQRDPRPAADARSPDAITS